jgi:hypothetical protein
LEKLRLALQDWPKIAEAQPDNGLKKKKAGAARAQAD